MTNIDVAQHLTSSQLLTEAELAALWPEDASPEAPSDEALLAVLDALILKHRGPRDPGSPPVPKVTLSNNVVLKKIRAALSLHEPAMLDILAAGGLPMAKRKLSPMFRRPDNKHFRECPDPVLEAFFQGLPLREVDQD